MRRYTIHEAGLLFAGAAVWLWGSVAAPATSAAADVLVCGDSMIKAVVRPLGREIAAIPSARMTDIVSIGTGLARPDVFDWPAKLREAAARSPAAAVVMLGANDGQALRTASGSIAPEGSPEWSVEYRSRVAGVLDQLVKSGAKHILWIGLPDMRDRKLQEDSRRINEIVRAECARVPVAEFFDSTPLFSPKPGSFSPYVLRGGKVVQVRASDGTHLNADGADILAAAIREKLASKLR